MTGDAAAAVPMPLLRPVQRDQLCWRLAPLSAAAAAAVEVGRLVVRGELAVMSWWWWRPLPVLLCCPRLLLLLLVLDPDHPVLQRRSSSTRAPLARLLFHPFLAPYQNLLPDSGDDGGCGRLLVAVVVVVVHQ